MQPLKSVMKKKINRSIPNTEKPRKRNRSSAVSNNGKPFISEKSLLQPLKVVSSISSSTLSQTQPQNLQGLLHLRLRLQILQGSYLLKLYTRLEPHFIYIDNAFNFRVKMRRRRIGIQGHTGHMRTRIGGTRKEATVLLT